MMSGDRITSDCSLLCHTPGKNMEVNAKFLFLGIFKNQLGNRVMCRSSKYHTIFLLLIISRFFFSLEKRDMLAVTGNQNHYGGEMKG